MVTPEKGLTRSNIDPDLAESTEWNTLAIDTVMAAFGSPPPSLTKWNTPTRR